MDGFLPVAEDGIFQMYEIGNSSPKMLNTPDDKKRNIEFRQFSQIGSAVDREEAIDFSQPSARWRNLLLPPNITGQNRGTSADGRLMALYRWKPEAELAIWDISGKRAKQITEFAATDNLDDCWILPDGRHVISRKNNSSEFILWTIQNGKLFKNDELKAALFFRWFSTSPDGTVLNYCNDSTLFQYRIENGKFVFVRKFSSGSGGGGRGRLLPGRRTDRALGRLRSHSRSANFATALYMESAWPHPPRGLRARRPASARFNWKRDYVHSAVDGCTEVKGEYPLSRES